jgi:hypothetical protein
MGIAIVEPAIVPDVYCSGRFPPEDLGNGDFRYTFYVKQRSISGEEEHVIVARLIIPAAVIFQCLPDTMKALGIAYRGEKLKRVDH